MELEIGEGTVFFLIRQKFWQSLEEACREFYKRTNDPFYVFWKAFAGFKLGNTNESINDLVTIQQKKEISYATYAALIYYHNQTRNIDRVLRYRIVGIIRGS
jgi:tetratricopeptide repeat protein 21B